MYGFGNYTIEIFDNIGQKRSEIADFQQLKIIDILNGTGSWRIESTAKTKCPFHAGDSVRILRNGIQIYSGMFLQYEEEYLKKYDAWVWSASGENHNKILGWKIVMPPCDSQSWYQDREFVMTNEYIPYIIRTLIDNHAKYGTSYGRWPGGFYLVNGSQEIAPIERPASSVNLRNENLLEVVTALANNGGLAMLPVFYDTGGGYFKVRYFLTAGNDKTSSVIFRDDQDHITSFRHILSCPEATDIIMSYNSDDTAAYDYGKMYHFYATDQIPNLADWRAGYQVRELFVKPKKEDFEGTFTKAKLEELCETYAAGLNLNVDCYAVEIAPNMSSFTYGYDLNSQITGFTTDYRLGDKIGILVGGQTYTGKVTRMEFDVAYGKETIRPTIGDVSKGKFNGILSNIGNLNKSTTKTDNTEVAV